MRSRRKVTPFLRKTRLPMNRWKTMWLDRMFLITTTAHFQPIGSVDTVHTFCLFGRYSQSQYARLVELSAGLYFSRFLSSYLSVCGAHFDNNTIKPTTIFVIGVIIIATLVCLLARLFLFLLQRLFF